MRMRVRLYVSPDCPLCDEAHEILRSEIRDVRRINIQDDPVLQQIYGDRVPVANFGDNVRLYWPFTHDDVLTALRRVSDNRAAGGTSAAYPVGERTRRIVAAVDRAVYHFARHWMLFIAGIAASTPVFPCWVPP